MHDEYLTIARPSRAEIKVQGSRFIGEALPVVSVSEGQSALEAIRKREYTASHHCYAYRIGHEGAPQFKYSDDGEPSGTAGRPIYDALAGAGLTDTLVVVTRYFGGTKLGTGGLAHAYADTAAAAIKSAGQVQKFLTARARCTIEFSLYERLTRLLAKLEAKVLDSQFMADVTLVVEIRRSRFDELKTQFVELTAGKGRFESV